MVYCQPTNTEDKRESQARVRGKADGLMIVIGLIGAISSVPQVLKIYQTGDVSGISLATYILAFLVILSWFFYGLYIKNRPLIYTSFLTAIISATVIVQILVYSQ